MSFKRLYKKKMADSTTELNSHFTGVLDPGIYNGMIVTSNSSLNVTISRGSILKSTGELLTMTEDSSVELQRGDANYDRIDVIAVDPGINDMVEVPASFAIYTGVPAVNPFPSAVPSNVFVCCVVRVRANSVKIVQQDIELSERIFTNKLFEQGMIEPLMYSVFGNRKLRGMALQETGEVYSVGITEGYCLINGMYQSTNASVIPVPQLPALLKSDNSGTNVITGFSTLKMPIGVNIEVTYGSATDSGTVSISGLDKKGFPATITSDEFNESLSTATFKVFEVASLFSSISVVNVLDGGAVSKVEVKARNYGYVYAKKHGHIFNVPIIFSTDPALAADKDYLKLGSGRLVNGSFVIDSSGAAERKLMSGVVFNGVFSGHSEGTKILHEQYGVNKDEYEVVVVPRPDRFNEATTVGSVWVDYYDDYFIVKNSGLARCSFKAMMIVREK